MNALINLSRLAWIQLIRHRVRSLLTVLGVASGMFLFTAEIRSIEGVREVIPVQ